MKNTTRVASSSLRLVLGIVLCTWAGTSERAVAQTPPPQTDRNFSPQRFQPTVGPDEFLTVNPAQPLPHLNFSLGLWTHYARSPLTIYSGNGAARSERARVVDNLLGADFVFALGLGNRVQIGVGLPLTLYQTGYDLNYLIGGEAQPTFRQGSGFALGDPWFDLKVRLYGRDRGFNLAVAGMATFPASRATPDNFGGDRGFGANGRLLAGVEGARWRFGVEVGYHWRQEPSRLFQATIANELRYGGAIAVDVLAKRRLTLLAEVFGYTGLGEISAFAFGDSVLEVDFAAKVRLGRAVFLTVGGGPGVLRGIGAPRGRGVLGLTIAPDLRDRDRDGIVDSEDQCVDKAEDKDGFQDQDGCPDPDNDKDGIPDSSDRCPNEAEDFDQYEDQDGCPDKDNDNDGVEDLNDACPLDKEDGMPPKPMDGCPRDKADEDNDGIPDYLDKCPSEPEDRDGFQDEDGCPDPDNDQDGYADPQDSCPNEAEDFDQFEDEDGCPEPDNDRDGLDDDKDQCPTDPETINGVNDNDGCPDEGPAPKVEVVGSEIVLVDKVLFVRRSANIDPRSRNLLDQLALTLRAHRELKKVLIEGHTDNVGDADKNLVLSQERADAVKQHLVSRGVAADRLESKGFGGSRPVADNRRSRGREANQRIELHVLEQAELPPPKQPAEPAGDGSSNEASPDQPAPDETTPDAPAPSP